MGGDMYGGSSGDDKPGDVRFWSPLTICAYCKQKEGFHVGAKKRCPA